MQSLINEPWLFFIIMALLLLLNIYGDRVLLDNAQREKRRQIGNKFSSKTFGIYLLFFSLSYLKHIYNQNFAIALTVLIVATTSVFLFKYSINELKCYDKDIFPKRFLQLKKLSAFGLPLAFLLLLPAYLNRLITTGYVPVSNFNFTTPIVLVSIYFVIWLRFGTKDDANTEYKPIFKQEKS